MSDIISIKFVPSLDTAVYAAGDVLFATSELQATAGSGWIRGMTIIDKDDLGENCDLFFLESNVAIGTRNAAPSITDAFSESIVGIMSNMAATKDLGGLRIATYEFDMPFEVAGTGILYVAAITNTALQHTAAGLYFSFRIERLPSASM